MVLIVCFKEEDSKPTEGDDGASGGAVKEGQNPPAEKPTTPAKDAREKEARKGILDAIRLPLVSVFPRKKKVTYLIFHLFFIIDARTNFVFCSMNIDLFNQIWPQLCLQN